MNTDCHLYILYSSLWMLPTHRVYLNNWRSGSGEDAALFNECGTTACAIGWACAMPLFKVIGLSYKDNQPCYDDGFVQFHGWTAIREFFGISEVQALCLFTDDPRDYDAIRDGDASADETYDTICGNADKDMALEDLPRVLRRLRRFMKSEGMITKAEAKALKKLEKPIEVAQSACNVN